MQLSILDYALSEQDIRKIKRRQLTIETSSNQLSRSVQNVSIPLTSEEFVPFRIFKKIIQSIEDKIQLIDDRLDNRERLIKITSAQDLRSSKSTIIQDFDETNQKVVRKQQQSQDFTKEEPLHNRLNLFEKKITSQQDTIHKLLKETDIFKKDIEQKVAEQLKHFSWSLDKFTKDSRELLIKVEDILAQHKEIYQHLQKTKDDLEFFKAEQMNSNEAFTQKQQDIENNVQIIDQFINYTLNKMKLTY
ncbi:hypothetical protein pb186bvf_000482 [Paramecium bursaria]